MLGIPDLAHRLEVAEDVTHQQVLLAEIIGSKYKTIVRLLNKDWKAIEITKERITDLIGHIQPVMTVLKKNSGNRLRMLPDIGKYWERVLYNRFYNIDKALGLDKFFRCLGTIERQYKRSQMLVAFQALNNITAYSLLIACRRVPSDHYRNQTINDFEKLLEQEDAKNISKWPPQPF